MRDAIRFGILISCVWIAILGMASAHAGNPFKGKEIYARHCSGCHGERGESKMIGVPNFAQGEGVVSSTDARLLNTIRTGKGIMPGFHGMLKDDEILDVIAHLRTFF